MGSHDAFHDQLWLHHLQNFAGIPKRRNGCHRRSSHAASNWPFSDQYGNLASVMGIFEYWQSIKSLRKIQAGIPTFRVPFVMMLVMSVVGVFLFFSIITKLL